MDGSSLGADEVEGASLGTLLLVGFIVGTWDILGCCEILGKTLGAIVSTEKITA